MVIMNKLHLEDEMAESSAIDTVPKSPRVEEIRQEERSGGESDNEEVTPENVEPNKATECSDCDSDSAWGIQDGPAFAYENSDEVGEGFPFQETNPPSTENIAQLTYKRDGLEQELIRVNAELNQESHRQMRDDHKNITISYNLGAEREALETFQRELQHFRQSMAQYGVVVETYPGCVVIKMIVTSLEQLARLKEDSQSGRLHSVIRGWLGNNLENNLEPDEIVNFEIEISPQRLGQVETFLQKDETNISAHFSYCKQFETWYWSIDLKYWHHTKEGEIKGGMNKGKRLESKDLAFLEQMQNSKSSLAGAKPCILCILKSKHPSVPKFASREVPITLRWKKDNEGGEKDAGVNEERNKFEEYSSTKLTPTIPREVNGMNDFGLVDLS